MDDFIRKYWLFIDYRADEWLWFDLQLSRCGIRFQFRKKKIYANINSNQWKDEINKSMIKNKKKQLQPQMSKQSTIEGLKPAKYEPKIGWKQLAEYLHHGLMNCAHSERQILIINRDNWKKPTVI